MCCIRAAQGARVARHASPDRLGMFSPMCVVAPCCAVPCSRKRCACRGRTARSRSQRSSSSAVRAVKRCVSSSSSCWHLHGRESGGSERAWSHWTSAAGCGAEGRVKAVRWLAGREPGCHEPEGVLELGAGAHAVSRVPRVVLRCAGPGPPPAVRCRGWHEGQVKCSGHSLARCALLS